MTEYTLAKKIARKWVETKTLKELENELYQLLILLDKIELIEIEYQLNNK
jgi:hypothetical protein